MGYGCSSESKVGGQYFYLGMKVLSLFSELVLRSDFLEPITSPMSRTSSIGVSVMMWKASLLSWVFITKDGLLGLE